MNSFYKAILELINNDNETRMELINICSTHHK